MGCRRVEARPFLGDLDWAEGAMALPWGDAVRIRAERKRDGRIETQISAPKGVEVAV